LPSIQPRDRLIVALDQPTVADARTLVARLGAGVTFARILAERDLAFLHAPARSIGGPAVRNMGTVGGNLFAPNPYGDFTVALLALDAMVSVQGGLGSREVAIEEFLQRVERDVDVLEVVLVHPGVERAGDAVVAEDFVEPEG